jgi:hypothetical protein
MNSQKSDNNTVLLFRPVRFLLLNYYNNIDSVVDNLFVQEGTAESS